MSIAEAVAKAVGGAACRALPIAGAPLPGGVDLWPGRAAGAGPEGEVSTALARAGDMACAGSRVFLAVGAGALASAVGTLRDASARTLTGALVIAVADECRGAGAAVLSDCRRFARIAHLPLLEPADPVEASTMTGRAFGLSEEFCCPVLLRLPAIEDDERGSLLAEAARRAQDSALPPDCAGDQPAQSADIADDAPLLIARDRELANYSNGCEFNSLRRGRKRAFGFVTSGSAFQHVNAAFPDSPVVKMGLSHPLPMKHLRGLAEMCVAVVVVESGPAMVESELRDEGLRVYGRDLLPGDGALSPQVLRTALARFSAPADR